MLDKKLKRWGLAVVVAAQMLSASVWAMVKTYDNPYEKVNWETARHICSTSHIHMTGQKHMDDAYAGGLRHFAPSNYYPSVPYYHLDKIRRNQFRVQQEHAVVVNGKLRQGPFNWNQIIMDEATGWHGELDPSLKKKLPFQAGDGLFDDIPADIVVSPNAEHHGFTDTDAHINSLGSFYSSGTFDVGWKDPSYKLRDHGYAMGAGLKWQQAFEQMLAELQFVGGGGITINHPVWSKLDISQVCQMLDHDDRVLGIEIWNQTCPRLSEKGYAQELWDEILATGRRCYGFSVPDHDQKKDGTWKGRNYLLVPEFNERQCLEAYRQGRFYCALLGNGLKFDGISFSKGILSVKTNKQALIKLIGDKGVVAEREAGELVYRVPVEAGNFSLTYLRIEAWDDLGEKIFSQPIMLNHSKASLLKADKL